VCIRDLSTFEHVAACIIPHGVCGGAREANAAGYVRWLVDQPVMACKLVKLQRAIEVVNTWAYQACGKEFAYCEPEEQRSLLAAIGSSQTPSNRSAMETLVDTVLTGFLCDPKYGGNRNATGWEHVSWK
jgi:hypothetical protein